MGELTPLAMAMVIGGVLVGGVFTVAMARLVGRSLLGRARREAAQTISNAEREAATILKEADTSIREKQIDLRAQIENEAREQRKELVSLEKRILAKEESIDKRVELLESKASDLTSKERDLLRREKSLSEEKEKMSELIAQQTSMLERISGLSADDARKELFNKLEQEVRRDAAHRLKRIEDELVQNSEKKAKWIITEAIQRCASDHVAESTVTVVALPSDEMKGRIIGREGRNIRALEAATGINVIIDDTPEAVILSGFDPVRREIARLTLERLIQDGRIHPARIEEMVQKVTEELNKAIYEMGEAACLACDVHGLHPEIIRLLGRLNYRTSYGQNVLKHSQEVCHLAGIMASELGLNIQETKRAALLHDVGKAIDHEMEGSHASVGYDMVRKFGENETIANAVGAHHSEMEQSTLTAVLVQAADALSAARPGARRETIETYIKRLQKLEELADEFPGVEKSYAIQAGREVRVVVLPDKVDDAQATMLARDIARKVEAEMVYPGQIRVTVVRETRAVDMAK